MANCVIFSYAVAIHDGVYDFSHDAALKKNQDGLGFFKSIDASKEIGWNLI
jgi:hypothetical protein